MDNTNLIRELQQHVHDAERRLDGLRAELARLVDVELIKLEEASATSSGVHP